MQVVGKDIQLFQETIRNYSEYDFSQYSHTSLRRRLTRILLEFELDAEEITQRMRADPVFLETIVRKLTVHTTELFRDPDVWKKIKSDLLPTFAQQCTIRIWHPGCSTGQEVYSMMMLLDSVGLLERCEIYGSDLNQEVLDKARQGSYKYHFNQSYLDNFDQVITNGLVSHTWPQRKLWKKYFTVDETHDLIQMKGFLQKKPEYMKLDLVKDPNLFLVNFDLIVCRNVIIYFNPDLQNRVFDLFYNCLNENGSILLGVHETIMGPFTKRFIRKDPFYFKAQQ